MPFPALTASGFGALEDSKYLKDNPLPNSISVEVDGGLLVSRKRFTRSNMRQLETGYTSLTEAEKLLFEAFYGSTGGADTISYLHPTTGETLSVLFVEPPQLVYTGIGGNHRWDITSIKLRTV